MILQPKALAERAFASVQLGDSRRADRAVTLATALFQNPAAPLPQQNAALKELRAAYRLLNRPEVTHAALQQPHWQQTRAAATQHPVVLFVQDTTELDYTAHPTTAGLGPIGNGGGRGFLLQSVLAVVPQPRQMLGVAYQEPFLRQPVPKQTSTQRKNRDRESQVWPRAAAAVGTPPPGTRWVHVGDAYSDMFDFLDACRQSGADFLVRVCQERRIFRPDGGTALLRSWARTLPAQAEQVLDLPARSARDGRPAQAARQARLQLAFSPATVRPPAHGGRGRADIPVWVVRVWEPQPPVGVEAHAMRYYDDRAARHDRGRLGAAKVVQLPLVVRGLSPMPQDGLCDRAPAIADGGGFTTPAGLFGDRGRLAVTITGVVAAATAAASYGVGAAGGRAGSRCAVWQRRAGLDGRGVLESVGGSRRLPGTQG